MIIDGNALATVADLAGALQTDVGGLQLPAGTLAPTTTLLAAGLLDGDLVVTDARHHVAPSGVAHEWRLEVVSGPDLGAVYELTDGDSTIGRTNVTGVRLSDPEVSRSHAKVRVDTDGVRVMDLGSTNGTHTATGPVRPDVAVPDGAEIRVGATTMRLTRLAGAPGQPAPSASIRPDGDGGLLLNRVPSLRRPFRSETVALPELPRGRVRRPLPWMTALLPLVFAGALYLITGTTTYLLFALLSPLTLAGNVWTNRRAEAATSKEERAEFDTRHAAALTRIAAAVAEERDGRLASAPDGAEVADISTRRTARLWERSPGDADFLDVRLGTGSQPASVQVTTPAGLDTPSTLMSDAPLVATLPVAQVLGIAGPQAARARLARALVTQLAGLHAADEVRLVLLADRADDDWEYTRWLPHIWHPSERRLDVALTPDAVDAVVERLGKMLGDRASSSRDRDDATSPAYVVLLDNAAALRRRPDVAALLSRGPRHGMYFIALDAEANLIPEERRILAHVDDQGRVVIEDFATGTTSTGLADGLEPDAARRAATGLAPIRRVGREGTASDLPSRTTLFELLGERPTAESVLARWARARQNRPAIPVGRSAAGVFSLDLVRSGPHALIGGMSGSGKSEFVQTWVASTALHVPPDELTFLFVEYKGLSAFLRLQHLPHCVGTITNLSPEMAERALTSLTAELRRRQKAFLAADVADINAYRDARRTDPSLPVMPRLLIVLDEFAEMKEDLPQFIDGLIRVARTGRSLGVHLILATQQVGRAVSGEISGNASLRISLRAAVPDDSFAVIDRKDAASIPQDIPGRAYAKRGEQPIELFQSAWSGGPAGLVEQVGVSAEPWPWRGEDVLYHTVTRRVADLRSAVEDVVGTATAAAQATQLPLPVKPFTQPLPALIVLSDLLAEVPVTQLADVIRAGGPVVGRRDDPGAQLQEPYALPLLLGHVSILGSAQSGRSTALRTTAASWAASLPPSMLQIHGIDGARGLTALSFLPHVGTVTTADDPRAVRLLGYLAAEVNRRLDWLTGEGVGELLEWWSRPQPDAAVPWTMLVVDRFEELVAAVERGPAESALERILTHGTAAGVTVLAAGDESLARLRWQSRFPSRVALRNTGGLDSIQLGLPPRLALDALRQGRGYETQFATQVQFGVVGTGPSTGAQTDGLRTLGADLAHRWGAHESRALRLRELPPQVRVADLPGPSAPAGAVLGIGGDGAVPVEVSAEQFPLLVVGPDKSGRSTALRRVATDWVRAGRVVTVLALPGTPLVTTPVDGAHVVPFDRGAAVDWPALLRSPDAALVADDLHRDDMPDALVQAMSAELPRCLFAGAMRGLTLVPEPLLNLARRGTLLYLCPEDPRRLANYEVKVDASACFTTPVGRGLLARDRAVVAVQVAGG